MVTSAKLVTFRSQHHPHNPSTDYKSFHKPHTLVPLLLFHHPNLTPPNQSLPLLLALSLSSLYAITISITTAQIPRLCLFRPPLRRCLPTPEETPRSAAAAASTEGGNGSQPPPTPTTAAADGGGPARANKTRGRGRALGLGLGDAGLEGRPGDGWEEGEPTDFVYTGLFPGEAAKGWGHGDWGGRGEGDGEEEGEEEPVLLFEDETVDNGQVGGGGVETCVLACCCIG